MDDTLLDIVKSLKQRWRQMAKFVAAVVVLALVVCLILPNIYQGKTTFYAASEDLTRPDVMFGSSKERTYFYGGRNEQDRILVIAEGGLLLDSLLTRHDLYTHYDIDPDHPKARTRLHSEFTDNFDLVRTDLDLLELTFTDEDPVFCATVANDLRELINNIASKVVLQAQHRFMITLQEKVDKSKKLLERTTYALDSLKRSYGIYDTDNQLSQLAEILTASSTKLASERARYEVLKASAGVRRDTLNNVRSRIAGLEQQVRSLSVPDTSSTMIDINSLNRIIPTIKTLESQYYAVRSELVGDEVQLDKLKLAMASSPPALLLVESASTPEDKHSPRRSIIMIITTLLAILAYIIGVILYSGYQKNIKHL